MGQKQSDVARPKPARRMQQYDDTYSFVRDNESPPKEFVLAQLRRGYEHGLLSAAEYMIQVNRVKRTDVLTFSRMVL